METIENAIETEDSNTVLKVVTYTAAVLLVAGATRSAVRFVRAKIADRKTPEPQPETLTETN
jgi:hypothetical protein